MCHSRKDLGRSTEKKWNWDRAVEWLPHDRKPCPRSSKHRRGRSTKTAQSGGAIPRKLLQKVIKFVMWSTPLGGMWCSWHPKNQRMPGTNMWRGNPRPLPNYLEHKTCLPSWGSGGTSPDGRIHRHQKLVLVEGNHFPMDLGETRTGFTPLLEAALFWFLSVAFMVGSLLRVRAPFSLLVLAISGRRG